MNDLAPSKRLLSIDALRGFDMLLIAGGGSFLVLLKGQTGLAWVDTIAEQLTHPAWHGFTFYDFIFPLFLFISGLSLSFSLKNGLAKGFTKKALYKKAFRRMLILIGLGILYKNAPIPIFEPSQIRLGSVLGRIGLALFITTLLYLNFDWKKRLLFVGGILLSYYAALFLIPVPGYGAGDLSFEGNLVGWVDRNFMPGRLLQKTYDELALLTQLPAMCLTIFGAWAGDLIQNEQSTVAQKIKTLFGIGVLSIGLGLLWSLHFPINKHLWTSSFILLVAGMAFLFFVSFYWLIDIKGFTKWAFFFKVIGMNSLFIYLVYRFVNFRYTANLLFGKIYGGLSEGWSDVFEALGALALVWGLLYFLYRKKLFFKI